MTYFVVKSFPDLQSPVWLFNTRAMHLSMAMMFISICYFILRNNKNFQNDTMVETEGTICQEAFRQEVTRILGGKDGLPDEWDKTAEMLRKTAETVLGVTFGKRKGDRETWWWNEKVQESIKEKKEAKKAWDKIRDENTKKIYKEKKSKAKKAVAMAKDRV